MDKLDMQKQQILPVILAGGAGTRLWPLSRETHPKQFLTLFGPQSMLKATVRRSQGELFHKPLIMCNEELRFLAASELRQMNALDKNILLEPLARNTAPAITLACLFAVKNTQNPLVLVLPADHLVNPTHSFQDAIAHALNFADPDHLITFGIRPTAPKTGYGYIKRGKEIAPHTYKVERFTEKPKLSKARQYMESGQYFWNSGILLCQAQTYLQELEHYQPAMLNACRKAMQDIQVDGDFYRVDKQAYGACDNLSVDYALMEQTHKTLVVELELAWSDLGTFAALQEILPKDEAGNAIRGDVINQNSRNNLILSENALVATIGLEDCVVVQTYDAVLVAHKDQAQEVRSIVSNLKRAKRKESRLPKQVARPWGHYDNIDRGARYQVKRITVLPQAKLSLQLHHHRCEHWIVVTGTAQVTIDGEKRLVTENNCVYIPIGAQHCLENPGKIPLQLIEVQIGSYLEEDDIIRLADKYGRHKN